MEELIKLQIVSLSPSSAGASSYILFLQSEQGKHLGFPMVIGLTEAQAISMFLEEIVPTRPMTHDLFANFINESSIKLLFVEITSFQDGVFIAKIHAESSGKNISLDARPSDSIALSLRLNIGIYISKSLLSEIAIPMDVINSDDEDMIEIKSVTDISAELEFALQKALAEENYEEAARLRDQLNQLTK